MYVARCRMALFPPKKEKKASGPVSYSFLHPRTCGINDTKKPSRNVFCFYPKKKLCQLHALAGQVQFHKCYIINARNYHPSNSFDAIYLQIPRKWMLPTLRQRNKNPALSTLRQSTKSQFRMILLLRNS